MMLEQLNNDMQNSEQLTLGTLYKQSILDELDT